jgi:OOP family OmpA-OmpF porin
LENAELCAENVSRVLPEAIILQSLQQDEQLVQAIVPTVEEAIHASVKKDLNVLADALFPVIGQRLEKLFLQPSKP